MIRILLLIMMIILTFYCGSENKQPVPTTDPYIETNNRMTALDYRLTTAEYNISGLRTDTDKNTAEIVKHKNEPHNRVVTKTIVRNNNNIQKSNTTVKNHAVEMPLVTTKADIEILTKGAERKAQKNYSFERPKKSPMLTNLDNVVHPNVSNIGGQAIMIDNVAEIRKDIDKLKDSDVNLQNQITEIKAKLSQPTITEIAPPVITTVQPTLPMDNESNVTIIEPVETNSTQIPIETIQDDPSLETFDYDNGYTDGFSDGWDQGWNGGWINATTPTSSEED